MKILIEISAKVHMCHCILPILMILGFQQCGFGQKSFTVTRDGISIADQKKIKSLIHEQEKICPFSYQYKKNYLTYNLKEFAYRAIIVDELIDSIEFRDSVLLVSYDPDFYRWSNLETIFYHYHDLYKSFFSFDEVKIVSVVLTNGYNVTFLPTIKTDSWMPVENAIMKRQWYIPDVDYVVFLGVLEVEAGNYSNENFEYIADKIDAKITKAN